MRRSSAQHRYEWFCYRIIASDIGNTPYEVYQILSRLLLVEVGESGQLVIRKSSYLEDWEHQIYIERIKLTIKRIFPKFIWPKPKDLPEVVYWDIP